MFVITREEVKVQFINYLKSRHYGDTHRIMKMILKIVKLFSDDYINNSIIIKKIIGNGKLSNLTTGCTCNRISICFQKKINTIQLSGS